MVGMQALIGRLTDVFEKSMMTPENGVASQRSLAITCLQDVDDDLSMSDKVKLIGLFQKDAVTAQTYLDLIHDDVCQAWLRSIESLVSIRLTSMVTQADRTMVYSRECEGLH